MDKPLDLNDVLSILAETMKFATEALAQQAALAAVLDEKGIVTKSELEAMMKQHPPQIGKLLDLLGTFDSGSQKPS